MYACGRVALVCVKVYVSVSMPLCACVCARVRYVQDASWALAGFPFETHLAAGAGSRVAALIA